MDQMQCPNCGGYKVTSTYTAIDKRSNKPLRTRGLGGLLSTLIKGAAGAYGVFLLIGSMILLPIELIYRFYFKIDGGRWLYEVPLIGVGFLFALFLLGFGWSAIKGANDLLAAQHAKNVYACFCQLCGYRWNWAPGDFYPEVRKDPNLIELGEKELERRRRLLDD